MTEKQTYEELERETVALKKTMRGNGYMESEEKYRFLFENMAQGVFYQRADGVLVDVNMAALSIFGLTRDQFLGRTSLDPQWKVITEDGSDLPGEQHPSMLAIKSGEPIRNTVAGVYNPKKDKYVWVSINAIPQFHSDEEKPYQVFVTMHDVTERKRAEEKLKENATLNELMLDSLPHPAMLINKEQIVLAANKIALNAGVEIGKFCWDTFGHRDCISEEHKQRLQNDPNCLKDDILCTFCLTDELEKTGTKQNDPEVSAFGRLWDTWWVPINEDTYLHYAIDITERKMAEKESEEKAHFHQTLLDALPCVALLLRPSTREIVASNAAGREAGAYPGRTCYGTWAQRDEPCPFCLAPKVWEKGKHQQMEVGAIDIIWDAHWVPISEDLYLHYAFDITEKRKMEARFQRSQKMESMGLMAGGIAHDLNNILSGIVSYPELILMDLPEDSKLRKPIETIKDSGMRAADVVSDLLTIARGVATGKDVLNLNTMVEEYLDSAEHKNLTTIYSSVTFKTDFDTDLLNIICSPTHIRKSLINLFTNAAEAIKGDGTISVSTMNRYLDEPVEGYEEVKVGEYAVLSVSDDGSGISEDDLERIFEPFYTKKVMGRSGTGLGLAVVWNTVQDHSGYINVSTSGKGTTFELYFPVTRDEEGVEKIEISLKDYIGHGERILVVDDEEQQREIARSILVRLDYKAEAVSSGKEAVAYLKEKSVDLVVLDMIMPKGMNGRETFEEILKIHPKQKAIIASGFSETVDVKKVQSLGAGKYIKKPYTMEKIGMAVKEELEK